YIRPRIRLMQRSQPISGGGRFFRALIPVDGRSNVTRLHGDRRLAVGGRRQGEDRRCPGGGGGYRSALSGWGERGAYGACGRRGVHPPSDPVGDIAPW